MSNAYFTISTEAGTSPPITDMKMIGERYKPDLLLVPIGGHYVLDPKDAAYATKELIKPKMHNSR